MAYLSDLPPGGLLPQGDAFDDGREIGPVDVVDVRLDEDVGEAALHLLEGVGLHRVGAYHDVQSAAVARCVLDLLRHVHPDHHARPQTQGRDYGNLAGPSPVNQQMPVDLDGRQEPRDRTAGADDVAEETLPEHDLLAAVDVGGDRGEGYFRFLEPDVVQDPVDIVLEVLGADPRRLGHGEGVEDSLLDQGDEIVQESRAGLPALLQEVELRPFELLAEDE